MANRERDDDSRNVIGCTTVPVVLTIGIALSLFGLSIGGGCSVRIPLTEANITSAGSIGNKESSRRALPNYLAKKVASSDNFVNSTTTLTIWEAEGIGMFVIGNQPGSPFLDLNLGLAHREGKINLGIPSSYTPRGIK